MSKKKEEEEAEKRGPQKRRYKVNLSFKMFPRLFILAILAKNLPVISVGFKRTLCYSHKYLHAITRRVDCRFVLFFARGQT